jgi:hypothetical protein
MPGERRICRLGAVISRVPGALSRALEECLRPPPQRPVRSSRRVFGLKACDVDEQAAIKQLFGLVNVRTLAAALAPTRGKMADRVAGPTWSRRFAVAQ